jgi:hypothetical protein
MKTSQHSTALIQALNDQNQLVLSNDKNLKIADSLIAQPGVDHSIEKARERWVCFVLLNVQELICAARKHDLSFKEFWDSTELGVLDHSLRSQIVPELLRTRGFAPEFVRYCGARRLKISEHFNTPSVSDVREPRGLG